VVRRRGLRRTQMWTEPEWPGRRRPLPGGLRGRQTFAAHLRSTETGQSGRCFHYLLAHRRSVVIAQNECIEQFHSVQWIIDDLSANRFEHPCLSDSASQTAHPDLNNVCAIFAHQLLELAYFPPQEASFPSQRNLRSMQEVPGSGIQSSSSNPFFRGFGMESATFHTEWKSFQTHEVTMNATPLPSRPNTARKTRQTATRPVPELLLEIAYRLHASKVVVRPRASQSHSSNN